MAYSLSLSESLNLEKNRVIPGRSSVLRTKHVAVMSEVGGSWGTHYAHQSLHDPPVYFNYQHPRVAIIRK